MTTALLLTLLVLLSSCLVRNPARSSMAPRPVHPAEGYLFGDPASPTRAERERMLEGATA